MPTRRGYLGVAAAPNGKIYAVGGANETGPLATVEEFDPATNTWTARASLPEARRFLAVAAASNGKLYATGGDDGQPYAAGGDGDGLLAAVEEYDPLANTWLARPSMATARDLHGLATTSDGKLYAVGGLGRQGSLAVVEEAIIRSEPTPTATPASADGPFTLTLSAGWNLVSVPVATSPALAAPGLVSLAQEQGVSIRQVARWQDGAWQSYLPDLSANAFAIEIGRGYFVRSDTGGQISIR